MLIINGPSLIKTLGLLVLFGALAGFCGWRYGRTGKSGFTPKEHVYEMKQLKKNKNIVPVVIIGSGPAGLSAAVYAARANLHTVIFEGKKPGGQLMGTSDIENWPGIRKQTGPEAMAGVKEQALSFGAQAVAQEITSVDFTQWPFVLRTDDGSDIKALTVIIATGASPKILTIPGENEYWGRGVSTCAICDAAFYKGKDVVVIGGGDSAAEEALQLAPFAKNITILVRGEAMRASAAMQKHLKDYAHINIRYNTGVKEVRGDKEHVTGVLLKTEDKEETMPIDGVFLAIGHEPNTALFKDVLVCNDNGYITLQPHTQKTSIAGVYAAGDVSDFRYRQAGVAAGDGIKAALDATAFLREHAFNDAIASSLEHRYYDPEQAQQVELASIKTEQEFEERVVNAKLPVFVDFYTPHCPSCLQMMPLVATVAAKLQGTMDFVKVDGAALPGLMERYSVSSVPTFLVLKEGLVVGRTSSSMTKREIADFVETFLVK